MKQQAAQVVMVEPTHFGFNTQTALSMHFSKKLLFLQARLKNKHLQSSTNLSQN